MANINEQILNLQREPLVVGAGGAVNSVNGQTGDVVLTAEDVGALPDSTVIPTKVSELDNDSDFQTGSEVSSAIGIETTAREGADNNLQSQIDAITASSDVTDIVGTYAQLQAYDTSTLGDNDIIKVLQDEEHDNETTYYRWSTSTQTFTLIGEEGPYYTKSAADQKFQEKLTASTNVAINANNEISADIPVFTGTDGVDAGTAGKVPAPATTDAGKYLKADGTWDSVQAGPTVVQTIGASTTDVMSQKATTNMIYPSGYETSKQRIAIGYQNTVSNNWSTALGTYAEAASNYCIAIGSGYNASSKTIAGGSSSNSAIAIGYQALARPLGSIAIGAGASVSSGYNQSVALGSSSVVGRQYELSIGSGSAANGTRFIANVTDPTAAQDAATKNYTDNLVISYSAINGASAPTTATEGKYIGQLYYDTTNEAMYFLKEIDTTTTPATYTWEAIGGGSITPVQTTGASSTDVMSQAATSNMIYPSGYEVSHNNITIGGDAIPQPSGSAGVIAIGPGKSGQAQGSNNAVRIGYNTRAAQNGVAVGPNSDARGQYSTSVGNNAYCNEDNNVAIGAFANTASNIRSVALGRSSTTTRDNEVSVGSGASGNYTTRYIANVTDPSLAQDAATKNYVDGTVIYSNTSGTSANFTLDDSVANYRFIEVYYLDGTNGRQFSTKIDTSIGLVCSLQDIHASSSDVFLKIATLTFSGTSATFSRTGEMQIQDSGNIWNGTSNRMLVCKVVGYK